MKILSTLWGLLVDDGRLASILLLSIVIGWGLSQMQKPFLAAIVIWAGLIVSLAVSIEHQLNLKLKK
ncbi:hypothetical protein [Paenibacillus sp. GP183]|uniref:hypothetical protein n=1 Tax=Paenibacillus sp. GP183 TaxID=1882751 RepID=UPI00089A4268|nr:hypothetical protein [Paenibacillus sp. GP183]SEB86067.1 hypothetical protein SAMN05443246_2156 [Paenibacillus sp. GP183]